MRSFLRGCSSRVCVSGVFVRGPAESTSGPEGQLPAQAVAVFPPQAGLLRSGADHPGLCLCASQQLLLSGQQVLVLTTLALLFKSDSRETSNKM